MFEQKKKLIIVHSADNAKYANYLQLIIGSSDDDGDTIIGVKDGSVETVVWSEDQYFAQKPTLSSADHILFVGTNKKLSCECFGMQKRFEKYGMQYSWLGKRGLLSVDKNIKRKEYSAFLEYAQQYISDIQKKMDTRGESVAKDVASAGAGIAAEATTLGAGLAAASGMTAFLPFAAALFAPAGAVSAGVFGGFKLYRHLREKRDVAQQQFTCLIIKFYTEGLSAFLEQ